MSDKPMKAYHVGENGDGEQVIVFATNGATARRDGGNELNLMFEEVNFCRRATWADEFAGQRFIPAKAYHAAGWWLYCNNCQDQLYEDAEDADGRPRQIAYDGRHAYCDQECQDERSANIAKSNARGEAFKAKLLDLRPDLDFKKWDIGWPHITQHAGFTFPGCKYGGSVRDQEGDGALEWYIANGDSAAWEAYEQIRQEATP